MCEGSPQMRCPDAAPAPAGAAPDHRAAARTRARTPGRAAARTSARARVPARTAVRARLRAADPPAASPPPVRRPRPVRDAIRSADRRVLAAFRACGDAPGVAAPVRGLGRAGEHAAVWLAAGTGAAWLDAERRD